MKFTSIGEMKVPGRGLIKIVRIPDDHGIPGVGYIVEIDGKKYYVLGVETANRLTDPVTRDPQVGLLVREM